MNLSLAARSLFLKEFVSATWLALKYMVVAQSHAQLSP